jgi:hypothetical protein
MTTAQRRLERAIKLAPPAERDRYAEEWRYDVAACEREGGDPTQISRGALTVAMRLRARQVERSLVGAAGAWAAIAAWALVTTTLVLAFLLGNLLLVVSCVVIGLTMLILAHSGSPSHWSHTLLLASTLVGLCSASFAWWVLGVRIDADDAGTSVPSAASYGGLALILLGLSGIGFTIAVTIAAIRARRRDRQT